LKKKRIIILLSILFLVILATVLVAAYIIHQRINLITAEPGYTDGRDCIECHNEEYKKWLGSHHDKAMQPAIEKTVLGNFNNAEFTYFESVSRFYKKEGKFYVNTEGPDGRPDDYEIKYTFGFTPLQQYLVEFDKGRLQCLTTAWDDLEKKWFHLYPEERITHDDWLHWTKGGQTWNLMCADCHSTNLQKKFDSKSEAYSTSWSEINVSCQACHGPGSAHSAWEETGQLTRKFLPDTLNQKYGLYVKLKGQAYKYEINRCGVCHSRRQRFTRDYRFSPEFLDNFLPSLLESSIYHADGQILEEVYVYGSFLQSKMYRMEVRCTNCHDAHSLHLKAQGNALCHQCHVPSVYDTVTHHFHDPDTAAVQCVDCHMTGEVYMGNDFRRDHSFRRPRPDLTVKLGTPNACSRCHKDQPPQWAADWVAKWYGLTRPAHFAQKLEDGWSGGPDMESNLAQLAVDTTFPEIARATALTYLSNIQGQLAETATIKNLNEKNSLLRYAAARGLERYPPHRIKDLAVPLLSDSVRAVRMEAARAMLVVSPYSLSKEQKEKFESAKKEFLEFLDLNSDFPSGQMGIGLYYHRIRDYEMSIQAYQKALRIDSRFNQARINLANLYNQQGMNREAEREFKEVIRQLPDYGEAYYSLGLLMAEEKRLEESVDYLIKADSLLEHNPRVAYNLGLALQKVNRLPEAEVSLLAAYSRDSLSADFLNALAVFYAQQQDWEKALVFAKRQASLYPDQPRARQLLSYIQSRKK
jgi:tetratricopeptide (TPR) repeat protein